MNRANNDSKVYKIMFFVREKGLAVETMAACRCLPVDNVMWGFYRFVGSARERTSDSPDFHVPLFMCNHVPRGHLGGDIGDENCTRLWIPEPMRILTLMTIITDAPPHAKACRKRVPAPISFNHSPLISHYFLVSSHNDMQTSHGNNYSTSTRVLANHKMELMNNPLTSC